MSDPNQPSQDPPPPPETPDSEPAPPAEPGDGAPDRREALGLASSLAMGAGLVASYGTFGAFAVRFLYPAKPTPISWRFIAPIAEWKKGEALEWRSPDGRTVTIVRQGDAGAVEDFIALSDVCPHLGCRVHWEAANKRFFCPCHNGAFDAAGAGISGPPADAGQSLPRYELRLESGRLFLGLDLQSAEAPPEDGGDTDDTPGCGATHGGEVRPA